MNQAALYFMPVLESARNENSSDDDRQHRLFRFIYPEDIWRSWCIDRLQRFKIIQPQIVVFFLWIFQSPHGSFARQLLVIDKVVCLMDSTKFLSFCKLDPCMIRNSPRIIIIIQVYHWEGLRPDSINFPPVSLQTRCSPSFIPAMRWICSSWVKSTASAGITLKFSS